MLFISHAWDDFEVTKWLALQLANEGYGVWCDITKFLVGENWPKEINIALLWVSFDSFSFRFLWNVRSAPSKSCFFHVYI